MREQDPWQRAKSDDFARRLRRADARFARGLHPIDDSVISRVRDICLSVFGDSELTREQADLLRPLLRELSANLNGCQNVERVLADFSVVLKMEAGIETQERT